MLEVGCAILAAYGFRGRVTSISICISYFYIFNMIICLLAIGVDLGTTFSVVGININKKVTMIEDDAGVLFPSVVSYLDTGGKIAILLKLYINNFDIEILVGREATARLESNPANTIFNSKRYIGRR